MAKYSDSIPGSLNEKRERLYQGILDLLSEKSRNVFDQINRKDLPLWNEHSFDVCHILANAGTMAKVEELNDGYLRMMAFSQVMCWPIFMDDDEFVDLLKPLYDGIINGDEQTVSKLSDGLNERIHFFGIARKEYPEAFPLLQPEDESNS